jgi:hypothetical protein
VFFLGQEEHPMKRVVSMVSVTRVVSAATVLTDANATETVKMGMNDVPRVVALYAGRGCRDGGHH